MLSGKVKWYNGDKGYGFITEASGQDYFIHAKDLKKTGYRTLNPGDEVQFEKKNVPETPGVERSEPRACSVRVIKAAPVVTPRTVHRAE